LVDATTSNKSRRIAAAVGFLSGMLACLDAVRDAKVLWPLAVLWAALRHPQRLESGGGLALIMVTLIISLVRGQGGLGTHHH